MEIKVDTSLDFCKEVIADDLLSEEEKGQYLLALHTRKMPVELMIKLTKLGHFTALDEEAVEAGARLVLKQVLTRDRAPEFLQVKLGSLNGVSNLKEFFSDAREIDVYLLDAVRTKNPQLSAYTKLNDLGLVERTPAEILQDKLRSLAQSARQKEQRAERKDLSLQILDAVWSKYVESDLTDAVENFRTWRVSQQKIIRRALRGRENVSLDTWLEAVDWFASNSWWSKVFFANGFGCVSKHYAHFAADTRGFAAKKITFQNALE